MSEAVTLKGNAKIAFENTPQIPVVEGDLVPLFYLGAWVGNVEDLCLADEGVIDFTKMEDMRNLFDGFNFTSLVLPEGFGQNATNVSLCFANCPNLTSLTLPDNFAQNADDTTGTLWPSLIKTLYVGKNFAKNAADVSGAFYLYNNFNAETLIIGEGFAQNAENATHCFHNFQGTTLEIGDNSLVKAKDFSECFSSSDNLKTLKLPKGFGRDLVVGEFLFAHCSNLETIIFNEDFMANCNRHDLLCCFWDCTSLKSLKLPEHFNEGYCSSIGHCFSGCEALESIEFNKNFAVGDDVNGVDYSSLFYNCHSLISLELPEGFGKYASYFDACFYGCGSLASISLPEGFGQNATSLYDCFGECQALTNIELPDGFGSKATNLTGCFYGCINLGYSGGLTLPAGCGIVATVIDYCFENCVSLNLLSLPDGFGKEAIRLVDCFLGCNFLTTITGNPQFKVSVDFSDCPLDNDSATRIVNGLQTVTETQIITFSDTTKTSLTEAGLLDGLVETASNKGWTLA